MNFEILLSTAMLGGFVWAMKFLLPRAIAERDPMAITCAALTGMVALAAWLLLGVRASS